MSNIIAPSHFPLRFSEVVNFRGDFGSKALAQPKGVAFHPGLNQVLVSLTDNSKSTDTRTVILNAVSSDGGRNVFASGYSAYRQVEAKLTVVPLSGPPVTAGFTPGDIFVNRGFYGEISRLSSSGAILNDLWVDPGTSTGLWGGLAFDNIGTFGGRLLAVDRTGKIFLIDSKGNKTMFVDLTDLLKVKVATTEGIAVAPSSFGPFGGHIMVGIEGITDDDPIIGNVYAIDKSGNPTLFANIGHTVENIVFAPSNGGTYYQAELSFERERENRLWSASASQFLARAGHMFVVNEMSGELWEFAWTGAQYTQSLAGRVPGRWTSEGINVEDAELEAGDFAALPPSLPSWNDWSQVPGNLITDAKLAASADKPGTLHIFAKRASDGRVYMQSLQQASGAWSTDWIEVPGGFMTQHSLAAALHEFNVHIFAVGDHGRIFHKRVFVGDGPLLPESWQEVPGNMFTDAAVTAATGTGRLVLCAKGLDNQLYANELAVGEGSWSGWSLIPGGGHTNAGPTLAPFQGELYLFIKGATSDKILVQVRAQEGSPWTEWGPLPGDGRTDTSLATAVLGDQCYVFAKGLHNQPFLNVASDTGTWSGWKVLPNPGTTDVGLCAAVFESRVYLFGKGIEDKKVYFRHTI